MHRVQRKRAAGWRMPEGAKYVGRPTRWGNPYTVQDGDHSTAVAQYRGYLLDMPRADLLALLDPLREYSALACWCGIDKPCHADVLLELLESGA